MKKLWLLLACALLLSTTSLASAACSPEEAQKKANEFAAAVQKKSQAYRNASLIYSTFSCGQCFTSGFSFLDLL